MKNLQQNMNVSFGMRLMAFFLSTLLLAIVAMLVMAFIMGGEATTARVRIATVIQDMLMFILPAIITAIIACRLPARLLLLNRLHRPTLALLLVVAVMVVSIPAMNLIVTLNEQLKLPESMAAIEQFIRSAEDDANASVILLMGTPTIPNLLMNLLIVGLLAGFSEEMFFRAGLQQLLYTRPMNPHAAIWITAIVFSAFHLQFYGFVPRLLLGAYFGYLAWWSRSIWLPIAAHALNNSAVVVTEWIKNRGASLDSFDNVGTTASATDITLIAGSTILTAALLVIIYRLFNPINQNSCDGK